MTIKNESVKQAADRLNDWLEAAEKNNHPRQSLGQLHGAICVSPDGQIAKVWAFVSRDNALRAICDIDHSLVELRPLRILSFIGEILHEGVSS